MGFVRDIQTHGRKIKRVNTEDQELGELCDQHKSLTEEYLYSLDESRRFISDYAEIQITRKEKLEAQETKDEKDLLDTSCTSDEEERKAGPSGVWNKPLNKGTGDAVKKVTKLWIRDIENKKLKELYKFTPHILRKQFDQLSEIIKDLFLNFRDSSDLITPFKKRMSVETNSTSKIVTKGGHVEIEGVPESS